MMEFLRNLVQIKVSIPEDFFERLVTLNDTYDDDYEYTYVDSTYDDDPGEGFVMEMDEAVHMRGTVKANPEGGKIDYALGNPSFAVFLIVFIALCVVGTIAFLVLRSEKRRRAKQDIGGELLSSCFCVSVCVRD